MITKKPLRLDRYTRIQRRLWDHQEQNIGELSNVHLRVRPGSLRELLPLSLHSRSSFPCLHNPGAPSLSRSSFPFQELFPLSSHSRGSFPFLHIPGAPSHSFTFQELLPFPSHFRSSSPFLHIPGVPAFVFTFQRILPLS
ncbi:hypothetical protein SK128_022276 [Halocaridina rubra]|uniref:Uncharacterized protein n=1 Tax=Halocaridina rubra TaxID=373956 RepID=A0AAN8XA75_HALRR